MINTIARRDQNDSNCCCYDTRLRTKTLIRHAKRHEQHDYMTKLQALVYDILPAATAITGYAIVLRKLLANEVFRWYTSTTTPSVGSCAEIKSAPSLGNYQLWQSLEEGAGKRCQSVLHA